MALAAGYALWVLLAGTVRLSSWFLRQSVCPPQFWGGARSLKAGRILYSHSFPVWLGQNLDKPESFGFLREVIQSLVEASLLLTIVQFTGNQITKLSIPVEGGSNVFAWLVTPLKLYAEHEAAFRDDSADSSFQSNQALAVQKLAEDPDSRLIIYCKLLDPTQDTIGHLLRILVDKKRQSTV